MINYSPFWETLKSKGVSTYALINSYHINSETINRLRKNKPVSLLTIDDLCRILECDVEDYYQI